MAKKIAKDKLTVRDLEKEVESLLGDGGVGECPYCTLYLPCLAGRDGLGGGTLLLPC